jgi:hypothetical protein
MACTSSCPTQDHASWGECVRSKNVAVLDPQGVVHRAKWDKDLSAYESARKQGIQPEGTSRHLVDAAVQASEKTGVAFQA